MAARSQLLSFPSGPESSVVDLGERGNELCLEERLAPTFSHLINHCHDGMITFLDAAGDGVAHAKIKSAVSYRRF